MAEPWRNRIVRTGTEKASVLIGNERNWRVHPMAQKSAMAGVLSRVGWVSGVLVNLRTAAAWGDERNRPTLLDGHMRGDMAKGVNPNSDVPVTYVDLDPEEERLVLATFDPVGVMAVEDRKKLAALLAEVRSIGVDESVATLLAATADRARLDASATGEARGDGSGGGGDKSDIEMGKPIHVTAAQRSVIEEGCDRVRKSENDPSMKEGRCLELLTADWLAGA